MSTDGTTDINESKYSFANKAKITLAITITQRFFLIVSSAKTREKKIVIKFDHHVNWFKLVKNDLKRKLIHLAKSSMELFYGL